MESEPTPAAAEQEPESQSLFSGLEPRAQRLLAATGAVALIVGLLGGFAVGFKVEQNRAKKAKPKAAAAKVAKSQKIARLAGVVTVAAPDAATITDTNGFHVKVATPSTVVVEKATKGSSADIKVGSLILLRGKKVGAHVNDAAEIVVLRTPNKFGGLKVTAVNGNKISVDQGKGQTLTINLVPTTAVYTVAPTTASQIAKGTGVLVTGSGLLGHDTFAAKELILLPPASAFAST